jgi:hypothetical protein
MSKRDKYYELETAAGLAADAALDAARTLLAGAEERDGGMAGWIVEERDVTVLRQALASSKAADDALAAENRRVSDAIDQQRREEAGTLAALRKWEHPSKGYFRRSDGRGAINLVGPKDWSAVADLGKGFQAVGNGHTASVAAGFVDRALDATDDALRPLTEERCVALNALVTGDRSDLSPAMIAWLLPVGYAVLVGDALGVRTYAITDAGRARLVSYEREAIYGDAFDEDGTEGQDRKHYSDDQDRKHYGDDK